MVIRTICFVLLTLSISSVEGTTFPWQSAIGSATQLKQVTALEANAEVTVSDGLEYRVFTSWQGAERSIFHRQYPDKAVTMGRSGEYYWAFDGTKQQDGSAELKDFILGHQFHALMIAPQDFELAQQGSSTPSALCECLSQTYTGGADVSHEFHYRLSDNRLMFWLTHYPTHGTVHHQFSDWRKTDALTLPYSIDITHQQRVFRYRFNMFALNANQGHQQHLAPVAALSDSQQLIRLHRDMIDAHIASDASLMNHVWAEKVTIVNRGDVSVVSGEQAAAQMAKSLAGRRHSIYRDMIIPEVNISDDGTLAFVTVQVYVQGNTLNDRQQPGKAFSFISAWIATFRKINGQWKLTANASNFAT